MPFVRRLLYFIDKCSDWSGRIFSMFLVLIMGIVLYEIFWRYVLNRPTSWAHETTSLIFGTQFIMGGAYCFLNGSMVNVDIIYGKLSARNKAIVDLVTFPLLFFTCGAMVWYGSSVAWHSIRVLEHTSTAFSPPLYPIRTAIPLGGLLLLLQGLAKFTRDLYMAFTGKELR